MTISSVDPFWSALAAYETGTGLPSSMAPGGATTLGAATSPTTSASPASAQVNASTALEVLGAPASSAGGASASANLLSQVLGGQSSSAAVAVNASVNQSILDMLL